MRLSSIHTPALHSNSAVAPLHLRTQNSELRSSQQPTVRARIRRRVETPSTDKTAQQYGDKRKVIHLSSTARCLQKLSISTPLDRLIAFPDNVGNLRNFSLLCFSLGPLRDSCTWGLSTISRLRASDHYGCRGVWLSHRSPRSHAPRWCVRRMVSSIGPLCSSFDLRPC